MGPENSYYLACKAFQRHDLDVNQFENMELTYDQFRKEKLANTNFTFWEYFESMMNLTKQQLESIWKAYDMIGFINKLTAEKLLENAQEGTFMIRFSDSTLGGVTIGSRSSTSKKPVKWIKFKEELALRKLADIISDLDDLKFLYPNIPKENFKNSLPKVNTNDDDYYVVDIRAMLPEKEKSLLDNVSPEYNPNDSPNSSPDCLPKIYPNGNSEFNLPSIYPNNGRIDMEPTLNGTNDQYVLVEDPYYHDFSNPNSSNFLQPHSNCSEPNSEPLSPNDGTTHMEATLNGTTAEDGQLMRHDNFSDSNSNSPAELYSNSFEPNSSSLSPNDGTTYTEPTLNGIAVDDALIVEMNELMRQTGITIAAPQ